MYQHALESLGVAPLRDILAAVAPDPPTLNSEPSPNLELRTISKS